MTEKNMKALLLRREYPALKVMLNSMNNVDLASLLENFTEKEYTILFRLIQKEKAAEVFTEGDLDQCLHPVRDQRTVRRYVYG